MKTLTREELNTLLADVWNISDMCKSVKAGLKNGHKKIFQSEDETVWIPPPVVKCSKSHTNLPLTIFSVFICICKFRLFSFFVCLFVFGVLIKQ